MAGGGVAGVLVLSSGRGLGIPGPPLNSKRACLETDGLAAERQAKAKASKTESKRSSVTPPAIKAKLAAKKAHRQQKKANFARISRVDEASQE